MTDERITGVFFRKFFSLTFILNQEEIKNLQTICAHTERIDLV
jgi:hypothetical protein